MVVVASYNCDLQLLFLAGAIAVTSGMFSEGDSPLVMHGVQCSGAESNILECSHSTDAVDDVCGRGEFAAVVCQGVCMCVCVCVFCTMTQLT